MSQGAMGVFWLTSNLPGLLRGEAGAVSTKTVLRCFVKITNPAGWDEYEKKSLGELKRDGYDGVILPDPDGSFDTIVFKPNQVKILPHEPQAKDAKVADVVQLPNPENPATDTPAFKSWFSGSKVVDAHGKPQRVYRGDFRADRIGDTFKVNRTTSGRFYFTDDPEIASRYSEKVDHRHVEENSEYASWFRFPQFKGRGVRKAPDMKQAWYYLTPEQRERVKHVALTTSTDEDGEIVFEADSPVNGNIEWEARQKHGNWLMALADTWLNSGVLYDDEPKFGKILERCGLNFAFDDPQQARSVVTPVYLRIRNPLDTSHIPQNVLDRLHQLAKSDRSRAKPVGYDQWDKTTKTVRDWVSMLDDDLRNHTTMAWTVIPEKVTQTLQSLGFDGIKDVGGKMGGNSHTVWIAFEPNQIKSALGNNGNYSLEKDSIVASQRNRLAEPEAP